MNGMRKASRDFLEFLAGILTEHMGFRRGKLERCQLCTRVERNTRGISCRRSSHLCQASDTREILDADDEDGRDQQRRSTQPARTCTRSWTQRFQSETYRQVCGRMLGHCSVAERKGSDDAIDGTEEYEPAR